MLNETSKDKAIFTLTLTQYLDGTCGMDSKSENGQGMKLIDVRQILQWALNRVADEIMMSAVKAMTKITSSLTLPGNK